VFADEVYAVLSIKIRPCFFASGIEYQDETPLFCIGYQVSGIKYRDEALRNGIWITLDNSPDT